MSVTITANNSKYEFDMGYGGFFELRHNIALAIDKELSEHYDSIFRCRSKADYEHHTHKTTAIILKKHLDDVYADVIDDFLYAPDCGGEIFYRTCQKIANLISLLNLTKNKIELQPIRNFDYYDFGEFLMECYSHRRKMKWY